MIENIITIFNTMIVAGALSNATSGYIQTNRIIKPNRLSQIFSDINELLLFSM